MSESDCIFCKIACGEMDAEILHEEESVIAFEDISAKAPVHVLVIPREHVPTMAEVGGLPDAVTKRLFEVAQAVAEKKGVAESGDAFRINNGPDSGQEVLHLHAHVMGGRRLSMP